MAARSEDVHLQILFGRAFLVALERGDMAKAQIFARAFLSRLPAQHAMA
jgi:hypothetical protein